MLTFRAIGDWSEDAVRVTWAASTRPTIPEVEQAIESAWTTAMQQKGIQLFDGPMCRLESLSAWPSLLALQVSRTSYKTFLGTNMKNPHLADRFHNGVLASPLGLSTSILSADGYVLLG